MSEWFTDWIADRATPQGAEPFADLRIRAATAINRSLDRPPLVLVVAHGALFRALRSAMGLDPDVRLPNATPVLCTPAEADEGAWMLTPAIA